MTGRRGLIVGRGASRRTRVATRGAAITLLCALALASLSAVILKSQTASAAGAQFYGVSNFHTLLASTAANTATSAATNTTTSADLTATASSAPTSPPTATSAPTSTPTATATIAPTPTATSPYNLNLSAAAQATYPQINGNYCGIATVALIAHYVNPGSGVTQTGIDGVLNTGVSAWGYPPPGPGHYGPGVYADIAYDFGTDPRSIAYGLNWATGGNYHAVVDTNGAWDATIHIVHDVLTYQQPISVFVLHGQHSVIVSGVEATDNPLTNPGSITYVDVWDPGGGTNDGIQGSFYQQVPINDWLGTNSWNNSSYFKYPYAANVYNGIPLDPDPSVGPYTYDPAKYNHLWVGHWVYVSPRGTSAPGPDWEINPNGALIAGYDGTSVGTNATVNLYTAIPAGYTGPTVPMPTNPPPPPPPVRPPPPPLPKAAPPPPKPTATPLPTPTMTPLPTPTATPLPPPTPTTPPRPVCDGVGCMLEAVQANPVSFGIPLLLLLLLGALAATPLWLPRLRASRLRGARGAELAADEVALLPPPSITEEIGGASDGDAGETLPLFTDGEALTGATGDISSDAPGEPQRDAPGDTPAETPAETPADASTSAPDAASGDPLGGAAGDPDADAKGGDQGADPA